MQVVGRALQPPGVLQYNNVAGCNKYSVINRHTDTHRPPSLFRGSPFFSSQPTETILHRRHALVVAASSSFTSAEVDICKRRRR